MKRGLTKRERALRELAGVPEDGIWCRRPDGEYVLVPGYWEQVPMEDVGDGAEIAPDRRVGTRRKR